MAFFDFFKKPLNRIQLFMQVVMTNDFARNHDTKIANLLLLSKAPLKSNFLKDVESRVGISLVVSCVSPLTSRSHSDNGSP